MTYHSASAAVAILLLVLPLAAGQEGDDSTAVRTAVDRYFDAYSRKDLDEAMASWSKKSPHYESVRQVVRSNVETFESIHFDGLSVTRYQVDGDKATVRVRFDVKKRDRKTQKVVEQRAVWTVVLAKEEGGWRWWERRPAEDDLARALIDAKDDEQRKALLAEDKELLTDQLPRSVASLGNRLFQRGLNDEALGVYKLAQRVAQQIGSRPGEREALHRIGHVHERAAQLDQAEKVWKDWLQMAEADKDSYDVVEALLDLGSLSHRAGRDDEALKHFEAGLKEARAIPDEGLEAAVLNNRGAIVLGLGRPDQALEDLTASLKYYRGQDDKYGEAKARLNLGNVHWHVGRLAEALREYQSCLDLAQGLGEPEFQQSAHNNLGAVHEARGEYTAALTSYRASLDLARQLKDPEAEATALRAVGGVYERQAKYAEALKLFEESLTISRRIQDPQGESKSLLDVGKVYQSQGRYAAALAKYEESLKLRRQSGGASVAVALHTIGTVLNAMGQYEQALTKYAESARLSAAARDRKQATDTRANVASVYLAMGRYGDALREYEAVLAEYRAMGQRKEEAVVLGNLGIVFANTARYAEAARYYEQSLKIDRDLGDRHGEAIALHNLGENAWRARTYLEALDFYSDSLKIVQAIGDREGEAETLNSVANAALRAADRAATREEELKLRRLARDYYTDSLKIRKSIGDLNGQATTLNGIGEMHRAAGDYSLALEAFRKALAICEPAGDLSSIVHNYWSIGDVRATQKDWPEAEKDYRKAIAASERLWRQALEPSLQVGSLDYFITPYHRLVEALLEQDGKTEQAFEVCEQTKARTLVDLLRAGKVDVRKSMTHEQSEKEQRLDAEVVALTIQLRALFSKPSVDPKQLKEVKEKLDEARLAGDQFRRTLYLARPELQTRRAEFIPAKLEELKPLFQAEPGLCVLSYLVLRQETVLFSLTAGAEADLPPRLTIHRLPVEREELDELVEKYRTWCARPPTGLRLDGSKLYDKLLAPAARQLAGKTHVVIVPDGVLHTLPFHALHDEEGVYFIEKYAVSYAPSVTALIKMGELADRLRKADAVAEEQGRKLTPLLAMGRPKLPEHWPDLPGSAEEAGSVARLFDIRPLLGPDASEARAKAEMGTARYVLFATHGDLNEAAPMYSAVVLTKGDRDDGFLHAQELVDLDLGSQLVVLSACKTAAGKRLQGEGLLGLTWALFVAGSPSSVVSQWSVADESTTTLVVEFFQGLREGQVKGPSGRRSSKAKALQQAQVKLLQDGKHAHPFYWAPFVLVGDWQN